MLKQEVSDGHHKVTCSIGVKMQAQKYLLCREEWAEAHLWAEEEALAQLELLAGALQGALRGGEAEAMGDHLEEVLSIAPHHFIDLIGAATGVLVQLAAAGKITLIWSW